MRVVDAYCGTGGWSAGAVAAGCTPILGIDCDEKPLQLWAANCAPHGGRAACATLGTDERVDWPEPAPDLHVHLSPPCTSLSKARAGSASAASVAAALEGVRAAVRLVLERGYTSWSLENVATPAVVACVRALAELHPARVAFVVLDAADYGCCSNRTRLLASTPAVVRSLKELPVRRVSVAEAFAAAELPLPADFLKSNTTNRDGSAAVRSVQQAAFTVTASHPLVWCQRDGATLRCLTVAESALLMGFPVGWRLPRGSRVGLRAVGNAVPPLLAQAVMGCAKAEAEQAQQAQLHEPQQPQQPQQPPEPTQEPAEPTQEPAEPTQEPAEPRRAAADELAGLRRKLRRLARRVEALEEERAEERGAAADRRDLAD